MRKARAGVATRWPQRLILVAIAAVAVFLLACGGDGGRELTPEEADTIALAALLTASDLPRADWTVTDDPPEEPEDDDFLESASACREFTEVLDALSGNAGNNDLELASHNRLFESAAGEPLTMVDSSVTVTRDPERAAHVFEEARELFTPDALRPCFEAAFAAAGQEEGFSITKIEITTPEFTLSNSAATAITIDLKMSAPIITVEMRMEFHVVVRDEIAGLLSLLEVNSTLLRDNQRAILEAFERRLEDALDAA